MVHVRAGELLYLPSQHFHHVQQVASIAHAFPFSFRRGSIGSSTCSQHGYQPLRSHVDVDVGRCCVAVNYWYDPRHDSRHVVPPHLLRTDTRTGT